MNAPAPEPLVPAEVDLPASRVQAIKAGSVRYFNGQPCPAGHVEARYTLNAYCVLCQRIVTRDQKRAAKARRAAA